MWQDSAQSIHWGLSQIVHFQKLRPPFSVHDLSGLPIHPGGPVGCCLGLSSLSPGGVWRPEVQTGGGCGATLPDSNMNHAGTVCSSREAV